MDGNKFIVGEGKYGVVDRKKQGDKQYAIKRSKPGGEDYLKNQKQKYDFIRNDVQLNRYFPNVYPSSDLTLKIDYLQDYKTLNTIIFDEENYEIDERLSLMQKILDILRIFHRKGFYHYDFYSSENIMIKDCNPTPVDDNMVLQTGEQKRTTTKNTYANTKMQIQQQEQQQQEQQQQQQQQQRSGEKRKRKLQQQQQQQKQQQQHQQQRTEEKRKRK